MFNFFKRHLASKEIVKSALFDEKTFYSSFIKDLYSCQQEIIIESPYITNARMELLGPVFQRIVDRNVKIFIITRDPKEHEENLSAQAEHEISEFELMGIQVFLCLGNHHRKLALLDRQILYEGSLNILSQGYSREIMRRIEGKETAIQMFEFLKLKKFIK